MGKKTAGKRTHISKKSKNPFYQKFKKHTNKHHIYPTSRFIVKKDPVLHTAWHDVFQNSTPEEAMEEVERWITSPEELEQKIFGNRKKLEAWKMLFGEAGLDEVLQIIQKDWTFRGYKMIKIN